MTTLQQDYSKFTVKQIKDLLISIGYKAPSGFVKAQLIQYLQGALYAVQNNIPQTNSNRKRTINFAPVVPDPELSVTEHLHTYGWAIDKLPKFDHKKVRENILSWIEKSCDSFKVTDPKTWIRKNIPYRDRGMFRRQLSHSEFLWYTRICTKPIFEKLWGTSDLLSSFDGCAFQVSNTSSPSLTTKHWMHCDQGRDIIHFACIQGIVNLYDNGPLDGGTILMNKSQTKFVEYIKRHPVDGIGKLFPVDPFDPILTECRIVKPCLKAGEILLFDSRMFHCNTDPQRDIPRSCVYVSMMPKKYCDKKTLEERIKYFEEGIPTNHWCYGPEFHKIQIGINPLYTKDLPIGQKEQRAKETSEIRSLVGY